jgi:hypothetical protein
MNLLPSKVGADPKRIVVLVVLVLAAGYFYFSNRNSGDTTSAAPRPVETAAPAVAGPRTAARVEPRPQVRVTQQGVSSNTTEFRPSLKNPVLDPSSVDPTLHLDLLAKLKNVPVEAGTRSLFEVSAAPPAELKIKEPDKIAIAKPFVGPLPPRPVETPPEPKAPPIPLKFYGFVNKSKAGDKRAFFLDGEDIVIAAEGDLIKKRFKIVRIGVNSAVVEDTEFKNNNQQTLPLEAEMAG